MPASGCGAVVATRADDANGTGVGVGSITLATGRPIWFVAISAATVINEPQMAAIRATTNNGTKNEPPLRRSAAGWASGIGSNQYGGVWAAQPAGAHELCISGGGAYVAVCSSVKSVPASTGGGEFAPALGSCLVVKSADFSGLLAGTSKWGSVTVVRGRSAA